MAKWHALLILMKKTDDYKLVPVDLNSLGSYKMYYYMIYITQHSSYSPILQQDLAASNTTFQIQKDELYFSFGVKSWL